MKKVVRTMGEILSGIGLQVVIFTALWFLTALTHIIVFLPMLIKMEEK